MTSYVDSLAEFASSLALPALPDDVHAHARLILLDTLGAIIGGMREADITRLAASLRASGEPAAALNAFLMGTAGVSGQAEPD